MTTSRNTIITSAISASTFAKLHEIIETSKSRLSISGILNRFALISCTIDKQVFEWLMNTEVETIAEILVTTYNTKVTPPNDGQDGQ